MSARRFDLLPNLLVNTAVNYCGPSREETIRLLNHDSMHVYYDLNFLPDGTITINERPSTAARAALIMPVVEKLARLNDKKPSVLDLACSPGYFMFKLAQLGLTNITGVDARADHRDQFSLLRRLYEYNNLHFIHSDIYEFLDREIAAGGSYDLCLLFGFLYHTSTPVELLRKIRRVCRNYLIVDTTVTRREDASLVVFEERTQWSRASTERISMMPSLRAVPMLLEAASFERIERIMPAPELAPFKPGGVKIDYYFDSRRRRIPGGRLGKVLGRVMSRLGSRKQPDARALFIARAASAANERSA